MLLDIQQEQEMEAILRLEFTLEIKDIQLPAE